MATADVGDERAALELLDDAVERRQPVRDEVGVVARAEEALAPLVDVVDVLAPAQSRAAARYLGDPRGVDHGADRDLKEPRQVGGTARIGERDRLLRWQTVEAAVGVIVDVAACRLGVQPLANVALGRAGALGQFCGRQPASACQRPIPAELVTHHHQRRVQCGSDFVHRAENELHELVAVDLDGLLDRAHEFPPGSVSGEARVEVGGLASGGHLVFAEPGRDRIGCARSGDAARS